MLTEIQTYPWKVILAQEMYAKYRKVPDIRIQCPLASPVSTHQILKTMSSS